MIKFKFLLFALTAIALCAIPALSQESTTSHKKSLIEEFRKLTGADKVNLSVNISTDIREDLNSLLEQEKEFSDDQKRELKKSIDEVNNRIDKVAKDFLNDQQAMTTLSEEIIYQIYDKNFTESELKELIAFYQTPIGQKAAAFLPTLSKQVEKSFSDSVVSKLQVIVSPKIQYEVNQFKEKLRAIKNSK